VTALLAWLDRPRPDRGVHFATAGGGWDFWPYPRLAALVRHSAGALAGAGVRRGDTVTIVEPTGPAFVGLLFGAMLTGATPSPVAPAPAFGDRDRYAGHLAALLRASAPALVVHGGPGSARVGELAAAAGVSDVDSGTLLGAPEAVVATGPAAVAGPAGTGAVPDPAGIALLQFTSGTTGRVRGVRVPYRALAANVAAIQCWLEMTPADPTASWLPVHHDMGLVGCLLAPVVAGGDLWLMSPGDFVRRPLEYLRCFGQRGARLTAMPAFGLDHIVRRVSPAALSTMDFAGWRAVIVGAERVAPRSLARFVALCGPRGLSRQALLPAYGLAEATLAVTGLPLRTGWTQAAPPGGVPVVGCGPPLPGVRVRIADPAGASVPDGRTGEIVVGGDGLAAGYLPVPGAGEPAGPPGAEVRTGDAGFLYRGQLHVIGRLGDAVKVRGRSVYAEDLDAAVLAGCDAPAGRVATLLGTVAGHPRAVLVLERPEPAWLAAAVAAARATEATLAVEPVCVPVGSIPRTSSGKPRRRELWQAYLDGRLAGTARPDPAGADAGAGAGR